MTNKELYEIYHLFVPHKVLLFRLSVVETLRVEEFVVVVANIPRREVMLQIIPTHFERSVVGKWDWLILLQSVVNYFLPNCLIFVVYEHQIIDYVA